jgi:hypothetical protein
LRLEKPDNRGFIEMADWLLHPAFGIIKTFRAQLADALEEMAPFGPL